MSPPAVIPPITYSALPLISVLTINLPPTNVLFDILALFVTTKFVAVTVSPVVADAIKLPFAIKLPVITTSPLASILPTRNLYHSASAPNQNSSVLGKVVFCVVLLPRIIPEFEFINLIFEPIATRFEKEPEASTFEPIVVLYPPLLYVILL